MPATNPQDTGNWGYSDMYGWYKIETHFGAKFGIILYDNQDAAPKPGKTLNLEKVKGEPGSRP